MTPNRSLFRIAGSLQWFFGQDARPNLAHGRCLQMKLFLVGDKMAPKFELSVVETETSLLCSADLCCKKE